MKKTFINEFLLDLHKKFVQTTIPEKISTSEAIKDPENNVAYVITIGGNPYFVHLTKQSFLSSASVVYFYDKNDIQHHQPLSAQMDCNYHGYVAGFPNSLVSLNICSGLRGTLQFKNISYALEPVESVSGFMHMIYEEKNDISAIPLLLENDTYSYERSQYKVRKSSERSGHTKLFPRYIDMYIVVDKNLIKPVNTPCREAADECDFVEFCTGNESMCVPDTYARNGEPCASGDAFCYDGRCRSTNKHCSRLIGEGARGAPFACFDEINARGDRYGNCGRGFCLFSHTLCGKLVCAWPYKTLVSQPNLSVIYTHVQDEICASAFLNAEKLPRDTFTTVQKPEDRDETFVEDGTICGPEMYKESTQEQGCLGCGNIITDNSISLALSLALLLRADSRFEGSAQRS
nr:PREDICTED: disintegrin and metalloproteinase domain-containing protein 5-like [Bos indicus]